MIYYYNMKSNEDNFLFEKIKELRMYKIKIKKMIQSVFNNYFKDKIRLKKYKITKIYLSLKN